MRVCVCGLRTLRQTASDREDEKEWSVWGKSWGRVKVGESGMIGACRHCYCSSRRRRLSLQWSDVSGQHAALGGLHGWTVPRKKHVSRIEIKEHTSLSISAVECSRGYFQFHCLHSIALFASSFHLTRHLSLAICRRHENKLYFPHSTLFL